MRPKPPSQLDPFYVIALVLLLAELAFLLKG
jgi:hypothetical protein